ncbi:hypothetical protein Bca4012_100213 [Brassica carinata]
MIPNYQQIHQLEEGISVRPIMIDQATTILNVTYIGSIFPAYSFSPQNYKCLLRSATTASYLPGMFLSQKKSIRADIFVAGTLELNSSPATTFYFDETIEHIKNYNGRIGGHRQS